MDAANTFVVDTLKMVPIAIDLFGCFYESTTQKQKKWKAVVTDFLGFYINTPVNAMRLLTNTEQFLREQRELDAEEAQFIRLILSLLGQTYWQKQFAKNLVTDDNFTLDNTVEFLETSDTYNITSIAAGQIVGNLLNESLKTTSLCVTVTQKGTKNKRKKPDDSD